MKNVEGLKLTIRGEREIVMTRDFECAAPPGLRRLCAKPPIWSSGVLLGPPGWSMPVCEIDLRTGGAYRYVWLRHRPTDMRWGWVAFLAAGG